MPAPSPTHQRLQRILADAGVASRRACEKLIEEGRVEVNGRIVQALPAFADPEVDRIEVDGKPIRRAGPGGPGRAGAADASNGRAGSRRSRAAAAEREGARGARRESHLYIMLNKPARTLTTAADEPGMDRRTVLDLVDHPSGRRLFPVGRLDYETTGLLLLTTDGELANRLTHPRYETPKTYRVVARGELTEANLEQLRKGLYLAQREKGRTVGAQRATPEAVRIIRRERERVSMEITLTEGRNREIRRLLAGVELSVRKLERVAVGPVRLKGVARGAWRELDRREVQDLRRAVGLERGVERAERRAGGAGGAGGTGGAGMSRRDGKAGRAAAGARAAESGDSAPAQKPAERMPRMRETIRVSHIAARGLLKSRLPQMAAALAYRTIFGIAPVIVISLAVLGAFATEEQIAQVIERGLEYTGLKGVEIPDASGTVTEEDVEAAEEAEAADAAETAEPERLDEWIASLVTNVSGLKFGAIGAIGVLILIYAALGMVVEVERAFNHVYRAPHGRSWSRRLTQYWTTLTLGALLLVATFYVGGRTKVWLTGLVQADQLTLFQSIWVGAVGFGITVAISTLLLLLLYTTVPSAKVRVPAALAGAFVAALLWEASKWGFTQYVTYSAGVTRITRVYGSLAILPLFLLWIYITWLVVLFGLQVSYGVQHFGQIESGDRDDERDEQPQLLEPAALLLLAGHLAERFGRGESLDADDAATRLSVSEAMANRLLERLEAAGIARRAADRGGHEDGWVLARPAERIRLVEVFDAAPICHPPEDTNGLLAGEAIKRLHECQRAQLGDRPLASLLGGEESEKRKAKSENPEGARA